MLITPMEIFDIILMTLVVGFVFMNIFKPRRTTTKKNTDDALEKYLLKGKKSFDWHAFWFAAMVTAPAILFHELGHKIVALSFGLDAVFNAAYVWLAIAVFLRLIGSSFIFFVPAYVSITGTASAGEHALTAFAGPAVNLLMFLIAFIVLKTYKDMSLKSLNYWQLTKQISLFLFIFNMIPIPGFDGFKVFESLWRMLGL